MPEGNIFEDDEEKGLDLEPLEALNKLVKEMNNITKEVIELQKTIDNKNVRLENISRSLIPSILQSAGLLGLKLSDGRELEVLHKLSPSITEKNLTIAYENMVMCEGGDKEAREKVDSLFKSNVVLGKIPSAITDLVENILKDHDVGYEIKRFIHYQTLGKYCRERLSRGQSIPEGISVFTYKETKIK